MLDKVIYGIILTVFIKSYIDILRLVDDAVKQKYFHLFHKRNV